MGDYGQLHQTEVLLKVLDKVHRNYSEVGVIVNCYITFVLVMLSITFLKIKDYLLHWWRAVFWTKLIVGLVSLGEWIWDWLWEVHLCTSFPLSPPSIREFRASQWGPEHSGMATELPTSKFIMYRWGTNIYGKLLSFGRLCSMFWSCTDSPVKSTFHIKS